MIRELLRRRVLIVTGKGGVGKSLVTAILACLSAKSGSKTIVLELSGQSIMQSYFGGDPGQYQPTLRRENLYSMSMTHDEGMEEYLTRELHSNRLYKLVFQNDYVRPFINAVPALEDLINTGKIMDLERSKNPDGTPEWDCIVVDGPPTGQGLNLLKVPQAIMDMTRVGPMYKNAKIIRDLLLNGDLTRICMATLPEEMPINETVEMYEALKQLDVPLGPVFVNELRRNVFSQDEAQLLNQRGDEADSLRQGQSQTFSALANAALQLHRRADLQRQQVTRLSERVPLPHVDIPKLLNRQLALNDVEFLADYILKQDAAGGLS